MGEYKEAVVVKVHPISQGIYDVKYEDGTTDQYVSHKLMRSVHKNIHNFVKKEGTCQSNLKVFKHFMRLLAPTRTEFDSDTIFRFKKSHEELMRCLGNIYEEEIHKHRRRMSSII